MPAPRDRIPQQASHSLRRRHGWRSTAGHDRGGRVCTRDLRPLGNRRRPGRVVESKTGPRAGIHDPARRQREAAHAGDGPAFRGFEKRISLPAASALGRPERRGTAAATRRSAGWRAKCSTVRRARGSADRRAECRGPHQKRILMSAPVSNVRPKPDKVLVDIADYVSQYEIGSAEAYNTARLCLMDTLGCGLEALEYPACTKLLGPLVPGTGVLNGARVPGTRYELDPVQAAFNIGAMIRWLDFNDTFLAAEWGHPSDNLGGILAVADYLGRRALRVGRDALTMGAVLEALIKAYEIQGVLALNHAFNRVGLDHVLLVRVASTAVVTRLLGGGREEVIDALSNAFVDGGALRTYRHGANTGSRKSWAAGDATSRAVRLALMVRQGEMGYPTALTAKTWGFYDALFRGNPFKFQRPYGSYVMEHVLFKISFPAEFHAQTAVEAAMTTHGELKKLGKTDADIRKVTVRTHEACIRIIDKKGPLNNPADRDHCIQDMMAVPM